MAFSRKHPTAADGTFSAAGTTAWNEDHGVTGADVGGIPHCPTATTEVTSANLTFGAATGQGLVFAAGTATTDVAAFSLTRTNNNAAVATGVKWTFTDTLSAAGFLPFQILGGSAGTTNLLSVSKAGSLVAVDSNFSAGTSSVMSVGIGAVNSGFYSRFTGAITVNAGGGSLVAEFQSAGGEGFKMHGGAPITWASEANITGASDLGLSRISAGLIGIGTGAAASIAGGLRAATYAQMGANAQACTVQSVSELTTIAAAATTDTAIQIPANAIAFGVSVRVTTVIPTAATFTVTGTTSGTAFQTGASVSTAATTTDAGTKSCPFLNTTAQTIRITPNLTPADNSGRVRVTIHYIVITPPTS